MNITIGMFRVESLWAHLFGIPEWTANVTGVGKRKNSNIFPGVEFHGGGLFWKTLLATNLEDPLQKLLFRDATKFGQS